MGNCNSSESTSVATVKLILHDGQLQEFSQPVKASQVLEKYPTCFICDSDDMEFGGIVSEVDGDGDLQPGQLYFALPKDSLKSPLQPAEMASLAVKASLALETGGVTCGCCRKRKIDSLLVSYERQMQNNGISSKSGGSGRRDGCSGDGGSQHSIGRVTCSLSSNLSVIPEEHD